MTARPDDATSPPPAGGSSIAIVGMACRYPDAGSPEELWRNVLAQRRAFRRFPAERLRLEDYLSTDRNDPDSIYAAHAAVIEGYEFDRARFRVAGPAYRAADLAHWLALDVAVESLADAGFGDHGELPRLTTGVILGNTLTGEFSRANTLRLRWPYVRRVVSAALGERAWEDGELAELLRRLETLYKAPFPEVGEETLAGSLSNTIAGRICNHLDLKGGGYTVDGACASSLLAVTTACSSLTAGDLDVALAGGVDLSLDPFELVGFARTGALAPELMRVFDARSAGFWPGEGCGFVVLMRAADALASGRRIHALIRGWGVASDGRGGITRPEAEGQLLALRRAYARAGYGADTVTYFEGHGTGTSVGDAVELDVLSRARREGAPNVGEAAVGTVKANIGHTKAAAGVAGLIKAVLAVHHQIQPPTTGCFEPHPALEGAAVRVLREAEPWPQDRPLRASVSAMGFGGIDTHVTLEGVASERRAGLDASDHQLGATPQDTEIFLFGAPTSGALREQVERVRAYALRISFAEMADLAAALESALPEAAAVRGAVVAGTPEQLEQRLGKLAEAIASPSGTLLDARGGVFLGTGAGAPRLGFLFPGQGSPTHTDGGAWRRRFGFARDQYDAARFGERGDARSTAVAQPAIVTGSLVGLRSLADLGLSARVAIGHSLGELAAWHWAGALDAAALVRLATVRGRAMADLRGPEGAMASLALDARGVESLIAGSGAVIAGLNHPRQTVIAGEAKAVDAAMERARAAGVAAVRLAVSHAFHSPLVAGAAAALEAHATREPFAPLERAVISTISGGRLGPDASLRTLLIEQLTSPVRFTAALLAAEADVDAWIEVGPGQTLSTLVAGQSGVPAIALDVGSGSVAGWLLAAGLGWALGAPLRHAALFSDRCVKPFALDWRPKFFINPCELAPLDGSDRAAGSVAVKSAALPVPVNGTSAPGPADGTALEIVRGLVAARTELSGDAIEDDHRLLGDLHLNSIVVGQIAIEASQRLGLPAPADPTAYAGATVAELARALEDLASTRGDGPAAAPAAAPPGVDAWVRPFAQRWVARPNVGRPRPAGEAGSGSWKVIAAAGEPLAAEIERELAGRRAGSGVVVCLGPGSGDEHIALLLDGARALWPQRASASFVVVQHGGGGFARSLHLESPETATCVVEVPVGDRRAAAWVADEALAVMGFREVRYDGEGARREPILAPLGTLARVPLALGAADVLLVTGGGKGIAAECALALARERGLKLGLVGRSRPAEDPVLAANLERLAAHGATFHYAAADVCDAAALSDAVREIEAALGPVTAVLHGAGANAPRPLSALEPADFLRTVGPKLGGVRNLAAALDPARLKLFIAIGSIIARTGLRGEADYAAANEWLADWVRHFQHEHPACRCRVIEWSLWSGVGMGERLGRVDALEREGIAPIPLEVGVQSLLRLIDDRLEDPVVVVAGRFGSPPTVTLAEHDLPLLRFLETPRVHYPGIELVADCQLSAHQDPYLDDHVFQSEPLLPAVMGLEAMAQAVIALTGTAHPLVFEKVAFARPIIVSRGGSETVRVAALVREDGAVDVALRCAGTQFLVDCFHARCRIAPGPGAAPAQRVVLEGEALLDGRLPIEPARDLYGSVLFQSGRFQRVSGYRWLRATECLAEIGTGGPVPWFGAYLPATLVLGDPGVRDAALHAVQGCIPHRVLLPVSVERIECARLAPGRPVVVRARQRSRDGDTFVYDLTLAEPSGGEVERWIGLRLRAVAPIRSPRAWAVPLLASYIERRLEDLAPGAGLRVAAGGSDQSTNGQHAIQQALPQPARVVRRPDGKPELEAAGPNGVSAAHADRLVLSVSGHGVVGCDVEPVGALPESEWRALLGEERQKLAGLVAGEAGESLAAACTRMWATLECVKKAGLSLQTPLRLSRVTEDGWVLIAAGDAMVATFIATTIREEVPMVFAVLAGNVHASV